MELSLSSSSSVTRDRRMANSLSFSVSLIARCDSEQWVRTGQGRGTSGLETEAISPTSTESFELSGSIGGDNTSVIEFSDPSLFICFSSSEPTVIDGVYNKY